MSDVAIELTAAEESTPAAAAVDAGADREAALALLRGEAAAAPEPEKSTVVASPAAEKVVEKPAVDPEIAKLFNRISAAEQESRDLKARLAAAEAKAAKADEFETKLAGAGKDPRKALELMKWDRDTFLDYVKNGDQAESLRKMDRERTDREMAERLARVESELRARDEERAVTTYKSSIRQDISKDTTLFPHLRAFHGSDDAVVDAIFDLQRRVYQEQKRELDHLEAAKQIETELEAWAKRLAGVGTSKTSAATITAPAASTPVSKVPPKTNPRAAGRFAGQDADRDEAVGFLRQALAKSE